MGRVQGIPELGRQNVTSSLSRARSLPPPGTVANGKDAGSCQVTGFVTVLKQQHFLAPSFHVVAIGGLARPCAFLHREGSTRLLYHLIVNRPDNSTSTHLASSAALCVFILSVGFTGATGVPAWRGAEGSWRARAELVPRRLPPALGPGRSLSSSAPPGAHLRGGVWSLWCLAQTGGASGAAQGAPGPEPILARHAAVPRSSWVLGWYRTSLRLIIAWSWEERARHGLLWRWKEFLFARAQHGAWLCLGDMVGLTGCVSPLKLNLGFLEGWVPVLFPRAPHSC